MLTLILAIGIVIAIPISTTLVFSNVFSLNYSKTPIVDLKAIEEVFDLQKMDNVSSTDIIPISESEEITQEIIIEEVKEEIEEGPTELIVENHTEIIIENQTEVIIENQTEIPTNEVPGKGYSINQISSGFILSDPLNFGELKDHWTFGGNAESLQAHYYHFTDDDGLHIGVQAPEFGIYTGYNAAVPPSNGTLFHSKITAPTVYIPNGFLQNGLYVQSSVDAPNFVSCAVTTSSTGKLSWGISRTYFDSNGVSQYEILWAGDNPTPSRSSECTIVTNGSNYLRVLLDRIQVYENDKLDLQMNKPFLSYLETQSSYAGEQLYGAYEDFYITSGDTIQVLNLPQYIGQVILTDEFDNLIASANVIDGTGVIDVGSFHLPITANIHAINNQQRIISTQSPLTLFGGDIFSVNLP